MISTFKLSVFQKRFLIIWILLNSFALFVNLANIEGAIDTDSPNTHVYKPIYLLARNNHNKDDFWPFTSFTKTYPIWEKDSNEYKIPIDTTKVTRPQTEEEKYLEKLSKRIPSEPVAPTSRKYKQVGETSIFCGIFTSYNLPEYIFYMCLGIGIVFIPKLWK